LSQRNKLKRLKEYIESLGSVLLAYSGGVDSTFLLKVAFDVLGNKVLAVVASSEIHPSGELGNAKDSAQKLGARFKIIKTQELKNKLFRSNTKERCYYCKRELFVKLNKLAKKYGLNTVVDGSNADDVLDYRPGAKAKKELGVISPLEAVGLTKKEIRSLSKSLGLDTWAKPALACLASRVPYHSAIDARRLKRIDRAEQILRKVFKLHGNLRVRDLGDTASIEVDRQDIKRLLLSKKPVMLLRSLGYKEVVIDPKGYRCGSLNEVLKRRRVQGSWHKVNTEIKRINPEP
jgi:pyridinium-3,5-biscarboxylic acid mononucleotide sulfurtransferase